MDRSNQRLNAEIERYIEAWDGTAVGRDIRNMYENGMSYECICERMGVGYSDYEEE